MIRKIENLAYMHDQGDQARPAAIFLSGFRSDMQGIKAQFIRERCKARSQSCLLLDYSGHGQSGGKFTDGTIGIWTQDALKIIDEVIKDQKAVIVGSSMGGWIALHVALWRTDKIAGVVGIAAAPDFTKEIRARLKPEQAAAIEKDGFIAVPSEYGDDLIITRALLEDGDDQCLLDADIPLSVPVTLIQGKMDADVPWQKAEKIKARLTNTQAKIIYIEDGDHRLSRSEDLEIIDAAICEISGV